MDLVQQERNKFVQIIMLIGEIGSGKRAIADYCVKNFGYKFYSPHINSLSNDIYIHICNTPQEARDFLQTHDSSVFYIDAPKIIRNENVNKNSHSKGEFNPLVIAELNAKTLSAIFGVKHCSNIIKKHTNTIVNEQQKGINDLQNDFSNEQSKFINLFFKKNTKRIPKKEREKIEIEL